MKRVARDCTPLFLALSFCIILAPSLYAQSTSNSSVSIQIIAYVPPIFHFTFNFRHNGASASGSYQMVGYIGDTTAAQNPNSFALASYAVVPLGSINIVSNLLDGFSIVVESQHSGMLVNEPSTTSIAYTLFIATVPLSLNNSTFTYTKHETTPRDGLDLPVSIQVGTVPSDATAGDYTDSLLFNIIAN